MEDGKKSENHLTSAAAFVEGGVQEACDDACSICLEVFCESEPSTVTVCKHEFHLQCILEWCQRSSQCPMCWQPISLKDPSSQELLEAIEQERSVRTTPSRNTAVFHHPTFGDFELQHLPVSASDAELEERIIQHLAAAAAMGRARHIARREGQRSRSSAQGRPHFLVFSTHPNAPSSSPTADSAPTQRGDGERAPAVDVADPTSLVIVGEESAELGTPPPFVHSVQASTSGSRILPANQQGASSAYQSPTHPSPHNQDRARSSEFQSFSESFKSRINAMSTRYKESISKSTRGWKERLFSRNNSMGEISSEVRREVNVGIATVSRMMERLETRDDNSDSHGASVSNSSDSGDIHGASVSHSSVGTHSASVSNSTLEDTSPPDLGDQQHTAEIVGGSTSSISDGNVKRVTCDASSGSN